MGVGRTRGQWSLHSITQHSSALEGLQKSWIHSYGLKNGLNTEDPGLWLHCGRNLHFVVGQSWGLQSPESLTKQMVVSPGRAVGGAIWRAPGLGWGQENVLTEA